MGITGSIEKAAFHPPDQASTVAALQRIDHRRYNAILSFSNTAPEADPEGISRRVSHLTFDFRRDKSASSSDPTILFSHGNAEDLYHSYQFFHEVAQKLDCRVVAYDYCGYGMSEGTCSEKSAIGSVDAVFNYVTDTLRAPRNSIVLCGRSLGSGPTTDKASRESGLGGLIILSGLASAAAVVGRATAVVATPWDIFCNIDKIHKVTDYPVLIYHGTEDEVINVSHGRRLFAKVHAVNPRSYCKWIVGAHHNDVEDVMGPPYFGIMKTFLQSIRDPSVQVPSDGIEEHEGISCLSSSASRGD